MKEALALAGGARRLSAREEEEELLGLLAGFPDADGGGRELSFSDLVEAGACRPPPSADADADAAPRDDHLPPAAVALSSAASKQRRQQAARQRARRSGGGSRGSCGGGSDGVLLNFYVPGLLTRSMTTPRPASRGPPSPGAVVQVQCAPAKAVAAAAAPGKASSRTRAALGIGCWPGLWGRGRRPAKACS